MMPVFALVIGATVMLAGVSAALAADRAPELNMEPTCEAAAVSGLNGRSKQTCLDSEARARSQLDDKWAAFSRADRLRCSRMAHTGGPPSYAELLTCLELAEAADRLPDTTGLGGKL